MTTFAQALMLVASAMLAAPNLRLNTKKRLKAILSRTENRDAFVV